MKRFAERRRRIVIYHEEMGVYLGYCMGFGFWSKLDPVGQDCAITFENVQEALSVMKEWENPFLDTVFIMVEADKDNYASIEACVTAGIPAWTDDLIEKYKNEEVI